MADHLWSLPTEGSSEGQRSCWCVALATVDLLGGLQTVGSTEEQSGCCPVCLLTVVSVSLGAAEFWGGFQFVGSVVLHVTESPGGLQTVVSVALLPRVQRSSWDAFNCCVFRGADKLAVSCSVALCVADLGCQLPCVQQISRDASGCDVRYPECSGSCGMTQVMALRERRLARCQVL